jgi:hypothetical protein
MSGWIGVDFDGTLATYEAWVGVAHTGGPVEPMVARVKRWLVAGHEVRIFTARIYPILIVTPGEDVSRVFRAPHPFNGQESELAVRAIQGWCKTHIGQVLSITCVKDYGMIELYDDRAVQVVPNTGELVGRSTRGLA